MKFIKLILVCSLALWFYCCNIRNNKTNTQETIAENIEIDASDQNIENSSSKLTKVYTMKKKDNTIIGDVYVKFENNTFFRYLDSILFRSLYVVNDGDTLYSVKNNVLLKKNEIMDFKYTEDIFYGYTLDWKGNDRIYITRWGTNGECIGKDVMIAWNYNDDIWGFHYRGISADNQSVTNPNEINNEFTKVYTMKKKDSTAIGDVYVQFENDSLFRYLHVINEQDTLYSIKKTVFLSNNKIDAVIGDGVYGYTFFMKENDYFYIGLWNKNGECEGESITIEWNYDENILEILRTL